MGKRKLDTDPPLIEELKFECKGSFQCKTEHPEVGKCKGECKFGGTFVFYLDPTDFEEDLIKELSELCECFVDKSQVKVSVKCYNKTIVDNHLLLRSILNMNSPTMQNFFRTINEKVSAMLESGYTMDCSSMEMQQPVIKKPFVNLTRELGL